jgi:hypothetical protein
MEIITANSLGGGRVVFQTPAGWSRDIAGAELLFSQEAVAAALARAAADAAANLVVDPYAIEVKHGPNGLTPLRLRERIRAEGPTTGNSKARSAPPPAPPTGPSPSRFAATLPPQGGEGSLAPLP